MPLASSPVASVPDTAPSRRSARLHATDPLPLPAYESLRPAYRRRLIAYRRARTVTLGPFMRLQFEDAQTIGYQVQEVLRAERIADGEGVQREIDAYAHLLPDGSDWRASLLIELPDATLREHLLPRISRAAHGVYVEVAACRAIAQANEDLADTRNARHLDRPSGVHFLRFALPAAMRAALQAGAAADLGCDDQHYGWRTPILPAVLAQLGSDLAPLRVAPAGRHEP